MLTIPFQLSTHTILILIIASAIILHSHPYSFSTILVIQTENDLSTSLFANSDHSSMNLIIKNSTSIYRRES